MGTMKPRLMSYRSATAPISLGRIAPPMIAMTIYAESLLARAPSPKIPSANIVGNMIDMKKYLRNTHATDTQPSFRNTTNVISTFIAPYSPTILCAANRLSSPAPVNRPTKKHTSPSDARFEAPLLLHASAPALPVSNHPSSQPCSNPECPARLVIFAAQEAGIGGGSDT